MATSDALNKERQRYETRVLGALGFTTSDPVGFHQLDMRDETVTFWWWGQGDPPPPPHGFYACQFASNEPARYTVYAGSLADGVWDKDRPGAQGLGIQLPDGDPMTTQQHDPNDPACDCPECMEQCRQAVELDRIWRAWREQGMFR